MTFIYVIKQIVYFVILILQFAMFVRAVLSWLPIDSEGKVATFLYFITEPLIMPVRALLERFSFVRNMPFDISFFVTFLLLYLVTFFLR